MMQARKQNQEVPGVSAIWLICLVTVLFTLTGWAAADAVRESPRPLPRVREVDVVVAGGSTAAVSAALAARESGASVLLVTPYTYLGDDIAATRRLNLAKVSDAPRLYEQLRDDKEARPASDAGGAVWIRPLHVKKVLEEAMLAADAEFLFGCFASELLVDEDGAPAGITIASRSGRQAVVAKVVIDATPTGHLIDGRRSRVGERVSFQRLAAVAGGKPGFDVESAQIEPMPFTIATKVDKEDGEADVYRATLQAKAGDDFDWARVNAIHNDLIDQSWARGQVDASEMSWFLPPATIVCRARVDGDWPGADSADLDAFRPADRPGMWVLSGAAAVSDRQAMTRCDEYIALGERIGQAAAREAADSEQAEEAKVALRTEDPTVHEGTVTELSRDLRGLEWTGQTVASPGGLLPVLSEVDVVVVGGGTGGAPAGISAARKGARTLVLELLHGLGGVSTLGQIPKYYHGYREGFTDEIDAGVRKLGAKAFIHGKTEWYRREIRAAGGEIWFGVLGCGAVMRDGRIGGVVVATPFGRGVVLAKRVIDATGNSDVAAAAGAEVREPGQGHLAVQGAGLPPIEPGQGYRNTDYAFAVDHDLVDMWRFFVKARRTFPGSYDGGTLIDTRERRRIVGDLTISPLDIYRQKRYADTICLAKSNFDTHGYTVHPLFLLEAPDREAIVADVPLRALLPAGIEHMLVTGLGISAHRDAMPLLRMQPDVQNQGYAAGRIAAISADKNQPLRSVDIREVQKHLVEMEIVPQRVLTETDSESPGREQVVEAVKRLPKDPAALAVILTRLKLALPALREAMESAEGDAKLRYAQVLGMCSDAAGADVLAREVARRKWDKGWRYRGMGQYGQSISELDSLIIALGRTGKAEHADVIIGKIAQMGSDPELSHCRAVAIALVQLGDADGAEALAALLARDGMSGHAVTEPEEIPTGRRDNRTRSRELRELILARACYRLGDHNGLAEAILRRYANDLRGLYARGARDALSGAEAGIGATE
jgi:flavin-dependent dehydrogenase